MTMTTAQSIREFLAFSDSTDLKVLQDAVDEVKAIARNATMDDVTQVYSAKIEVLNALNMQYNRVSRAAKESNQSVMESV